MFMTQLESAVAGIVTKEMSVVAEKERMDKEVLRSLVAEGKVVIPCNKIHTNISPEGLVNGSRLLGHYPITRSRWCRFYYYTQRYYEKNNRTNQES